MNPRFEQHIDNGSDRLFIPFITAGDPSAQATVELAVSLQEAGANAIELGIPYSDPLADGPVIQRASIRALQQGMTLEKAIELVSEMRGQGLEIPVIIFTYYNLLLQLSEDRFFTLAHEHEVDGLLVPDLPFEESEELMARCDGEHMPLIPLVTPTTSFRRLEEITARARGFVYCVSSRGVTGVRKGEFKTEVYDFLDQVKQLSSVPTAVGFGISDREQIKNLQPHCNGVIIGSAIVAEVEKNAKEWLDPDKRPQAKTALKSFVLSLTGQRISS